MLSTALYVEKGWNQIKDWKIKFSTRFIFVSHTHFHSSFLAFLTSIILPPLVPHCYPPPPVPHFFLSSLIPLVFFLILSLILYLPQLLSLFSLIHIFPFLITSFSSLLSSFPLWLFLRLGQSLFFFSPRQPLFASLFFLRFLILFLSFLFSISFVDSCSLILLSF